MAMQCAFCPNEATTGEHLWSDWVGKLLGEKSRYVIRNESEGKIRKWKSVGLHIKKPVLCETCNNEWGSEIETEMKQIVSDMVLLACPKTLDGSDVQTILRYSLLKAFVCDYANTERKSFYDFADRYAFRSNFTIPKGIRLWLGGTVPGHGVFKGAYIEIPPGIPDRYKIYVFTVSIGQLVIQVTIPRFYSKSKRKHSLPPLLDQNIVWARFCSPVWPRRTFPIVWPPSDFMDHDKLDMFVERWRQLKFY